MARRRRQGQDIGINLFSFLNIMTATIGVQALLIVIFALQIKPGVQSIRLLPAGGEGAGLVAYTILCNGDGRLDLIAAGQRLSVRVGSPELERFLDRIAQASTKSYLVVGVRPDGFRDFEVVRSKAESRRITLGYEPLEEGLEVIVPSPSSVGSSRAEVPS